MLVGAVRWAFAATVLVAIAALPPPCSAQQINKRKTADPGTNANTARIVTRATLQAKQNAGDSLKNDDAKDLIVNTNCGPVQIGGQQSDSQSGRPRTLVGNGNSTKSQNTTVVQGDVVNICRR